MGITTIKFKFKAKGGGMEFADMTKWRLKEHMKEHEGMEYDIIPRKKTRTLTQNAYYWVYLEIIENDTGNTASDLHELFKRMFLPPRFVTYKGKEIKLPSTTTNLEKYQFGEYLDKICAETNVPLPDPQEAGYISNY